MAGDGEPLRGPQARPHPAQRAAAGGLAGTAAELRAALSAVTVEEFRIEDLRCERDSRLGRQLLFLLTNTGWTRRTTESVEIRRARAVDTEVVVDVDLTHAAHSALASAGDLIWLPVLSMPPVRPERPAPAPHLRRHRRRKGPPQLRPPDPMTSLEVTDAAGVRVPKVPQAEIHRWLAAALAEILLNRLPRDPADRSGSIARDQLVLLAAAIRRVLPGDAAISWDAATSWDAAGSGAESTSRDAVGSGADAAGSGETSTSIRPIDTARARAVERLTAARSVLVEAMDADLARARPVLRSRVIDMVDALVGAVVVVIQASRSAGPTSYVVRVPARRLRRIQRGRRVLPRARLRIDLLTASANADRLIRLTLPDGIGWVPPADPATAAPLARIEVVEPRVMSELRALTDRAVTDPEGPVTWSQRRLASMAADQVDGCLSVLTHYRVPPSALHERATEEATQRLARRLVRLRELLVDLSDPAAPQHGRDAQQALIDAWQGGEWLPLRYERRLTVNTATPGVVHIRATSAEGSVKRASPTAAVLDVEVAVTESTVLDTARDTSLMTLTLLALVTALLMVRPASDGQILATVLTLFPAIQASRIERPDRSTLRGLLTQPTYLLSLATTFPPVALAAALALHSADQPAPRWPALVALTAQMLLHLAVRRRSGRPDQGADGDVRWRRSGGEASLTLATDHPPDIARMDRLRGRTARTTVADVLLLGHEAHAYVALDAQRPGAVETLLAALHGTGTGAGTAADERFGAGRPGGALREHDQREQRDLRERELHARDPDRDRDREHDRDRDRRPGWRPAGGSLLGMLRGGAGGQALTFAVVAEQVRTAPWLAARRGVVLHPVPLTAARLTPAEPPAWIVEILVGLPMGTMGGLPLEVHPLTVLGHAAGESGFALLLVQHPSPPPAHGRTGLEWLRLRAGVPFAAGEEDLTGLHRFLDAVDRLRVPVRDRPACAVHVYVVPELATYEAGETVPLDGAGRAGPGKRPRDGVQVVAGADVLGAAAGGGGPGTDPPVPVAVCGGARPGLLADVMQVLAEHRPQVRLAGIATGVLHGLSVLFLFCSGPEGSTEGLGALIRDALAGTDELEVPVDGLPLAGTPGAGPAPDGGVPRPDRPGRPGGPLLRMQLRSPDRPEVLLDALARLGALVRHQLATAAPAAPDPADDREGEHGSTADRDPLPAPAADYAGLDVVFAMLRMVDGRSLQGRLTVWLPAGAWTGVDWSSVTEPAPGPGGSRGGSSLVDDDPVITVDLVRAMPRQPGLVVQVPPDDDVAPPEA